MAMHGCIISDQGFNGCGLHLRWCGACPAHHCAAGGVNGQDVGKLLAAGDAAMSDSQYASAISQYTAALAIGESGAMALRTLLRGPLA